MDNGLQVRIVPEYVLPIIGYTWRRNHKKYRINKKWHKQYGMRPIFDNKFTFVANRTLYISNKSYNKLKEEIDK